MTLTWGRIVVRRFQVVVCKTHSTILFEEVAEDEYISSQIYIMVFTKRLSWTADSEDCTRVLIVFVGNVLIVQFIIKTFFGWEIDFICR